VSALDLRGEHFAENDFQIKEPHRIATRAAKLFDDFPSRAGERSRVCAINGPT
jgi:hypothetical protein